MTPQSPWSRFRVKVNSLNPSRGVLTIMDSTHNTNEKEWCVHFQVALPPTFARKLIFIYRYLYTLTVRDEFGSWIPCAHFPTERLEAGIIVKCLKADSRLVWTRGWVESPLFPNGWFCLRVERFLCGHGTPCQIPLRSPFIRGYWLCRKWMEWKHVIGGAKRDLRRGLCTHITRKQLSTTTVATWYHPVIPTGYEIRQVPCL